MWSGWWSHKAKLKENAAKLISARLSVAATPRSKRKAEPRWATLTGFYHPGRSLAG